MQTRKEYVIQFVGLSIGTHLFDYTITDKFFENLDYSEIKQGNLQIKLALLKQSNMMVLQFEIKGKVKAICDRCTEQFDLPIEGSYKLIVKVGGNDTGNENDDIITIAANEHELDLSQCLYEYITLSVPIKRIHPDNSKGQTTCNKKILKELNDYLIENEEKHPSDPRWDELRKIKLN